MALTFLLNKFTKEGLFLNCDKAGKNTFVCLTYKCKRKKLSKKLCKTIAIKIFKESKCQYKIKIKLVAHLTSYPTKTPTVES